MQCEECLVDMRVKEVKGDIYYFECIKCGKSTTKTKQELEIEYEKKNKVDKNVK